MQDYITPGEVRFSSSLTQDRGAYHRALSIVRDLREAGRIAHTAHVRVIDPYGVMQALAMERVTLDTLHIELNPTTAFLRCPDEVCTDRPSAVCKVLPTPPDGCEAALPFAHRAACARGFFLVCVGEQKRDER